MESCFAAVIIDISLELNAVNNNYDSFPLTNNNDDIIVILCRYVALLLRLNYIITANLYKSRGHDYKIAANGKLMRKGWIRENDDSQMSGTQGDGNPSNHGGRDGRGGRGGNTGLSRGRGRGRGRNTSMGGNQRMVTLGSTSSVRTEGPTRSSVRDTFPSNREERYTLWRLTSRKVEPHNHGI